MKKLSIACVALATVVAACGQPLQAAPASFVATLAPGSQMSLFVSAFGGFTALIPIDVTGTVDVILDDAIDDPALTNDTTLISLVDATIDITDQTTTVNPGPVTIELNGAGINALDSNGPIATTSLSPVNYEYVFDPGGGTPTDISIDEGSILLDTGVGSISRDFLADPFVAIIAPLGPIGFLTQNVSVIGGNIVVDVVISLPITLAEMDSGTSPIDVSIEGVLIATGSYTTVVPEPSTLVLLGISMIGLIPLLRTCVGRARRA